MFILAGAAGALLRRRTVAVAPVVLLLALFAAESLSSWPNYLAYFNVAAGGPRHGYRHLVDSSLDWGQGLPGLKKWLVSHGLEEKDAPTVYLSYFGSASPDYYAIHAEPLPGYLPRGRSAEPRPLTGGVYCISATMLQGVYLFCPGPWDGGYESEYRRLAGFLRRYEATRSDPEARRALLQRAGRPNLATVFEAFEQLRLARLCAFLRRREPEDQVGYSVLIYRLSADEVRQAVDEEP
jgi:hypothetical protein